MHEGIDKNTFEELYIKVREKEKRLYADQEVSELPNVNKKHAYYDEWVIRKLSFEKLKKNLLKKNKPLNIFDIGCGNGWMSNKLSEINNATVVGIDTNLHEVEQARRVFRNNKRLAFVCGNILENTPVHKEKFDIIVLAASIQYFPDLNILIKKLFSLLNPEGEIHILDSPFYNKKNVVNARAGSLKYYTDSGYPSMAAYYHHHAWQELAPFNFRIKNRLFLNKLFLKIFKTKANYFPWIIIKIN